MNKTKVKLNPTAREDGSFSQQIGPIFVIFEEDREAWWYEVTVEGSPWDDGNYESLEEAVAIVEDELTALYRVLSEVLA